MKKVLLTFNVIIFVLFVVMLNFTIKLQHTNDKILEANINVINILKNISQTKALIKNNKPKPTRLSKGIRATNFVLLDETGKSFNLYESNKDKYKLLVFSDEHCGFCADFYPELEKFSKKYKNQVDIYVVQLSSSLKTNSELSKKYNSSFKTLVASEKVFVDYKIDSTPSSIVLDKSNNILSAGYAFTAENLQAMFDN